MDKIPYIDQSGLYAIEDVIDELVKNNITVLLVDISSQPESLMKRVKLIPKLVPEEHIFKTFSECTQWIKNNVKDQF
jgi:SulP family sulfate permease